MYFGCFFFNAHGYKYITLNADLSEYIIIFTSHLFISFIVGRERKKASSGRYGRERKKASSGRYGR